MQSCIILHPPTHTHVCTHQHVFFPMNTAAKTLQFPQSTPTTTAELDALVGLTSRIRSNHFARSGEQLPLFWCRVTSGMSSKFWQLCSHDSRAKQWNLKVFKTIYYTFYRLYYKLNIIFLMIYGIFWAYFIVLSNFIHHFRSERWSKKKRATTLQHGNQVATHAHSTRVTKTTWEYEVAELCFGVQKFLCISR